MKSIKTALINIRRAPYKSMAAVLIISLTFFVAYSYSMLLLGSKQVLQFFEKQPKVIAFFEINATSQEVSQVAEEIKEKNYVATISVDTKEEALEYYQQYQDNPLLLELVSADILPASLEAGATDPSQLVRIKQDLQQYPEIDDVVLYQDIVESLNQWTQALRVVGIGSVGILSMVSLLIMAIIISLKISHKQRSISILRFIGATSGYIITPFIYEGFIYGLIGSVIGWLGMYAGYLYLTPWLTSYLGEIIQFPLSWELFALQAGVGTSIALLMGGMASVLAAKKLIKD